MAITNPHTAEDTARNLYAALNALMDELGPSSSWDADVELLFRRDTLERALLALDAADFHGYGSDLAADAPPRFLRTV